MKTKILLLTMLLMLAIGPVMTQAAEKMTKEQTEIRVAEIRDRVEQIKAMNVNTLSRTERKALKHELRSMNKELKEMGPTYVYISVGGLILIIILLLILL